MDSCFFTNKFDHLCNRFKSQFCCWVLSMRWAWLETFVSVIILIFILMFLIYRMVKLDVPDYQWSEEGYVGYSYFKNWIILIEVFWDEWHSPRKMNFQLNVFNNWLLLLLFLVSFCIVIRIQRGKVEIKYWSSRQKVKWKEDRKRHQNKELSILCIYLPKGFLSTDHVLSNVKMPWYQFHSKASLGSQHFP